MFPAEKSSPGFGVSRTSTISTTLSEQPLSSTTVKVTGIEVDIPPSIIMSNVGLASNDSP